MPKAAREGFGRVQTDKTSPLTSYPAAPDPSKAALSQDRGNIDWRMHFDDVERDLALLIGGGSIARDPGAPPEASLEIKPNKEMLGRSGTDVVNRTTLEQLREQLELFYD